MRVIFTFCAVLLFSSFLFSQPYLFSVTHGKEGGTPAENPYGTLSKFDVATNALTVAYGFKGPDGAHPSGKLVQASDGLLYGTTEKGGANNAGVLFSFDPSKNVFTKLYEFATDRGVNPVGHLIQAKDGKLYGMTKMGGLNGLGVVYSFDIVTKSQVKLFDFNGPDGAFPNDGLLEALDGKLYGTTPEGGAFLYGSVEFTSGVLFSYDPVSRVFSKLHEFGTQYISNEPYEPAYDGAKPYGSLIQAKDGKLYGTTAFGGESSGTVFSLDPVTQVYTIKIFPPTGQFHPFSTLLEASNKRLYGTTKNGGTSKESGVAFSFNPQEHSLELMGIHSLATYSPGPLRPTTSFIQAKNGNLYGISAEEGPGLGVLFSHNIETKEFSKKVVFNGINGAHPVGALTEYLPCTNGFKVSIPDVAALPNGVSKNTVYPGYVPAASIKLQVQTDSSSTYTFKWSTGATTPHITVSPSITTTYSVLVTDTRGCTSTAQKEIKAVSVVCGNKNDKVLICKSGPGNSKAKEQHCVNASMVAEQLSKGASLGNCSANGSSGETSGFGLTIKLGANPSSTYFNLQISSAHKDKIDVTILDAIGRVVERQKVQPNTTLQVGSKLKAGTYYAVVTQGLRILVVKLVKQ